MAADVVVDDEEEGPLADSSLSSEELHAAESMPMASSRLTAVRRGRRTGTSC